MDQNQFLRDFLKMRHEIRAKESHMSLSTKRNAPSPALVNQQMPKPSGMTLATIIEDKPSKTEVVKYLRHKLDNLLEEMSD